MIIPSIDLAGGDAVQLVGGREEVLRAGDPRPIARRFGVAGEVAVVDLDAAMRRGSNAAVVEDLLSLAPCRVGGGIRDVDTAIRWLDAGATRVVLGTAARPEVLAELPRERVIAALDAMHGEVMVDGWREGTGESITSRMERLRPYVWGFLVTFIEGEGRMGGVDLDQVRRLAEAAGDTRLTIAGGITTGEEIAGLDRLGVDAQVGMSLYQGRLGLGEAVAAPLVSDRPDGLWPTVVVDEREQVLGLVWSSAESLRLAVEERQGIYQSRSRGIWRKGETSGATQELLRVAVDCDRDALKFTVHQHDGFCHLGTRTCFGPARGLGALEARIGERAATPTPGSVTRAVLEDPDLLASKLREEAVELGEARRREEVIHEAADVLYFTMTALAASGVSLSEVEDELDRRALRLTRRPVSPKEGT